MSIKNRLDKIESETFVNWQKLWVKYDKVVWVDLPDSIAEYMDQFVGINDVDHNSVNELLSTWTIQLEVPRDLVALWLEWQDILFANVPFEHSILVPDFSKSPLNIPYPPDEIDGLWEFTFAHFQNGSRHEKMAAAWLLFQLAWARSIRSIRKCSVSRLPSA